MTSVETFLSKIAELSADSSVNPTILEVVAKKAATQAKEGGIPLSAAIVRAVRDEGDIFNPEHVRRIVEIANTSRHLLDLKGGDTYPVFDIADYDEVISALQTAPTSTPSEADYSLPPEEKETSPSISYAAEPEVLSEKSASLIVRNTEDRLSALHESLEGDSLMYEELSKQSSVKLAKMVRSQMLDGADPSVIKVYLENVVDASFTKEAERKEMQKWANRSWDRVAQILDPKNPDFGGLSKIAAEYIGNRAPNLNLPMAEALLNDMNMDKQFVRHKIAAVQARKGLEEIKALRKSR